MSEGAADNKLVQAALRILMDDQTGVGIDPYGPDDWMEGYMERKEWERRLGEIIDLARNDLRESAA